METTRKDEVKKAILVGLALPNNYRSYGKPLEELANLADSAGVQILGRIYQARGSAHPITYTGKGKLLEIQSVAQTLGANVAIYDDDLTPKQSREIEKTLGIRVMDRTELILHIFEKRAQSNEAKLQVELAQAQYRLPRLKRLWKHLDRYEGGLGMKGPGEKQLELDKRILRKRIQDLTVEIKEIQERKKREVNTRSTNFITVGIVGYTNAGKSTLMNMLTNAGVLVENRLFSTIDTRTRTWEICQGRQVLLSDTVGFIDKLPHNLVASFRATLEEAAQSEVLLHVVDVSDPDALHHIKIVDEVLQEIGISHKAPLLVLNKIDKVTDCAMLQKIQDTYPQHVLISALNNQNIDLFTKKVLDMIELNMNDFVFTVPATQGKLMAWIEEYARILEKKLEGENFIYRVRITSANASWLTTQLKSLGKENSI